MSIQAHFQLDKNPFQLDVTLDLPGRGVSVLFGPSGAGKSTILRCLAGLEPTVCGSLTVNGECWQDQQRRWFVPPHQRGLGMVFQDSSLFPHLNVRANLEFGLRRTPAQKRRVSWQQALNLLGIEPLLKRQPQQLSGGERQRIAIARALLTSPQLLLMDEPLAALDFKRKQEILPYLQRLQRELDIPIVYVSHAIEEVVQLADHLVLLNAGQVVAAGTLNETLSRLDLPTQFCNEISVVLDTVVTAIDAPYQLAQLSFNGGKLWAPSPHLSAGDKTRVRIQARDISITLTDHSDSSILNRLPATVESFSATEPSSHMIISAKVADTRIVARITKRSFDTLKLKTGQSIWLQIKAVSLV